jgi:hypothetical protein
MSDWLVIASIDRSIAKLVLDGSIVSSFWAVLTAFVAEIAVNTIAIRARQQIPKVILFILFVPFIPLLGVGALQER